MPNISPSILSADLTNLSASLAQVEPASPKYWHIDVMDGHFVPNLTFGPSLIKQLKGLTKIPLDVHLMIDNPLEQIDWYIAACEAGDVITVHFETLDTPGFNIIKDKVKAANIGIGLSIKPATPAEVLIHYLSELDLVLLMSVEPGFSGQEFMPNVLEKLDILSENKLQHQLNFELAVDGGINVETAPEVVQHGAELLVAGNAIFGADDPLAAAQQIAQC